MPAATVEPPKPIERPGAVFKSPAVWHLLLIALLAEIGYAVLNISTMPVYLAHDPGVGHKWIPEGRGLGESVIGFVLVAFLFSEAIFKSPMGSLADRIGYRRLMLIGPIITACTSICTLLIPLNSGALEVLALILLRIADGVGAAMLWPAAFALMGSSVEDNQRQQAMSLLNLCYIIGIALALPIGGAVNVAFGHTWASLFLASILFSCVALAVFRFVPNKVEEKSTGGVPNPHEAGFGSLLLSMRQIPSYMILSVVTFAGVGFPMAIIKLFALHEFGLSELAFGGLVFPAAISAAVLSVPLSRYGEHLGKAKAVHFGMGLCAAGLFFVSFGAVVPVLRETWALALGTIPIAVGFLLAIPAWMASVSDIDPSRTGSNIGAVMTAQGIGAIIGAPIGATMYEKLVPILGDHAAHYAPFVSCASCIAAGWLLSLRILREPKK